MARAIPQGVPESAIAGDTLEFDYTNSDFPVADGWTLSLVLTGGVDFTTAPGHVTTDGDTYKVKVPAADFKVAAGEYRSAIVFTKSTDRITAERGKMTIEADPAVAVNDKTHAEKMVEVLEARLYGRAVADIESYQVEQRAINKIPFEKLEASLNKWRRQVRMERGDTPFRSIKVILADS